MTIETKYNIGDKVWARGNYGKYIIQCEVQDLRATAVFLDPNPTIEYTLRYCVRGKLKLLHRLEEDVFPTEEELCLRKAWYRLWRICSHTGYEFYRTNFCNDVINALEKSMAQVGEKKEYESNFIK